MKTLVSIVTAALITNATADESMAKAVWISEATEITQGDPVRTIIRMTVKEGWHTYWVNPGEGGMELSLKAELPEGWTIGELQYPVPKRFMTGELPGFGYEGEIDFPITLTPPSEASGALPPLNASLSWLTCNDDSCVPGDAELVLPGRVDAEAVSAAYEKLPQSIEGAKLGTNFEGKIAFLSVTLPEDSEIDPAECEFFPITPNIIDPAAKPIFLKQRGSSVWLAAAEKSEYLSGSPEKLELLLVSLDGNSWVVSTE
ncbi:MAG: protein-disulfide reductase DsbD family protein [Akkermansiaceae bacterium]|jgi:DsbC/DsbD-like thiol-disulfide interchange protein|nr:protein-disulfide reductase DsbD family protein [Akkermansiaceae bacterium]MDP4647754.1 protein-disulfide reductase DsbD family protein [Akkermansiaceae bacterium]MDP4721396.1 protein-disulfide reductase DsbD family protein [Akkermansiaceae bacterium]MDP4781472.1 protein-disulfide reductase DsbD family protein [Akkermansiaceae bacterium]MDP4847818.1 protein-disulfide reductase DsbD family protein [Akkermansiaceae bacterium]